MTANEAQNVISHYISRNKIDGEIEIEALHIIDDALEKQIPGNDNNKSKKCQCDMSF